MLCAIVGYESSGALREALRAQGVDAWSCDLQPADDGSPYHLQGDVWDFVLARDWDFGIFHPTCTYLTNSAAWAFADPDFTKYPGVGYHQKVGPGTLVGARRRAERERSLDEVRRLMALPYPKAIENPVGAIGTNIRKPDDILQPYEFGDDASKATCLWLDRLPRVVRDPAARVSGRYVEQNGRLVERWSNQTDSGQNRLSPGEDRWTLRSKTYTGIAAALAAQWTSHMRDVCTGDTLEMWLLAA